MKRQKTLQSDAVNQSNIFCHPAHDDEQQQQAAAAAATAVKQHTTERQQKYMAGTYKDILVRRAAAYSIITSAKIGALRAPHFSLLGCVKRKSYVLMHV